MTNRIKCIFEYWIADILNVMPGNFGNKLRYLFYRSKFETCGINISISQGFHFHGSNTVSIGSRVGFGLNNQIYASGTGNERIEIGNNFCSNSNVMINADIGGRIRIGNDVIIGPNVVIRASNHRFQDRTIAIKNQGSDSGTICIEDDVWIGANVVILPNVVVGKGSIIGAGAVVTKNVDPYSIYAGVPAKKIADRP